jgi:hypothetical protein
MHVPSLFFCLASSTALTGANPTAFEIKTPSAGQKKRVTHSGAVEATIFYLFKT